MAVSSIDWSKYGLIPPDEFKEEQEKNKLPTPKEILGDSYEKAREEDNYWDILSSNIDRVKADKNDDNKISYAEYKEYILQAEQPYEHPINTVHHQYSLDYSFYIVIGLICLSTVLITWFKKKQ